MLLHISAKATYIALIPSNMHISLFFFLRTDELLSILKYPFFQLELSRHLSSSVVLGIRTQVLRKPEIGRAHV
jgi:hypothetical protein